MNSVSKAAVLPARTSAASPSAADFSTDSPTKKRSGPTYSTPISPLLLLLLLHRSSLNPYTETGGSFFLISNKLVLYGNRWWLTKRILVELMYWILIEWFSGMRGSE